jgi:peptidoglycan LD-endopeptidase CwlK
MSYQLLKSDVLFYQRFLKANGFYEGKLDGIWGPKTNKADAVFLAESEAIAQQFGGFDVRSESNIITLIPKAQIEARKFLIITKDANIDVRIISGTRTYTEQNILYSLGRNDNPGPIVTNAKGGQSNHNFGIAWDIGIFDLTGKYITDDEAYISIAEIVLREMDTIEWGGNWRSFKDFPHYQLKAISDRVTTIRRLFEKGEVYV